MIFLIYWYYESEITSVASNEDFRSHANSLRKYTEYSWRSRSHASSIGFGDKTRSRVSGGR